MKAIVVDKRGSPDGLTLQDVAIPVPAANELLIKVHAATVTRGDVFLRKLPRFISVVVGALFGFKAQKIPGVEYAGVVEAVGQNVTRFKVGDAVFGTTTGLSYGANAEFVCVPETPRKGAIELKPAAITFAEAAAIPVGSMTALYFLRQANLSAGQSVLVYGASGSVGTYAVQLAKHFGANVTAVCSTQNTALVTSLGADTVIDYTRTDLTQTRVTYDVVFDAVGKLTRPAKEALMKKGGYVLSIKSLTNETSKSLAFIKELLDAGELKAVIDKVYPLEQTANAHRYVEGERKKGNVVISLMPEPVPAQAPAPVPAVQQAL